MKVQQLFFLLLTCFCLSCERDKESFAKVKEVEISWSAEDRQFLVQELEGTTTEVIGLIKSLNDRQWNFVTKSSKWSIKEITEHLIIQNELHFRELLVLSKAPSMLEYTKIVKDQDEQFLAKATDTIANTAQWYLEPIGRFCSKEEALKAFQSLRKHLIRFVEQTPINLRTHFTFRDEVQLQKPKEIEIGDVRDLHQLLLTGIAHTKRHLNQIAEIRKHPDFPSL